MCELTTQALEADSKPVAPLPEHEYIRLIEVHLGMIDNMLAETRALIRKYQQEHKS